MYLYQSSRLVTVFIFIILVMQSRGQVISSRKADGFIASTGNLYFTSHDANGATVWRSGQGGVPGSETILYWEQGAIFGDITFAKVGADYFGYFFEKNKNGVTQILRVPLAGGDVSIMTAVDGMDIVNSRHNLVTDGTALFWQSSTAINKLSINGGPVAVLEQTTPGTPTAGVEWLSNRIFFAVGNEIRYVSTDGTQRGRIAMATNRVVTLHTGASKVYWGEVNGAVRVWDRNSNSVGTAQESSPHLPVAIANDGEKFAWSQCGLTSCELKSIYTGDIQLTANAYWLSILTGGNILWGSATGVKHLVNSNL